MMKGCFGGRCGHSFNRCGVLDAGPHAGRLAVAIDW